MTTYQSHTLSPRVGVLLEVARRASGLSLRSAARALDCDHSYLLRLEQTQRAPSVMLALDLAKAYRLGPAETQALLAESVDGAGRSKPSGRH